MFNIFGNGNKVDRAQKREYARSFDFAQNTWFDLNGKKVGRIDARLISFPNWLSMDFINENHLNELIANYDEEMESIPVFSVHPEEKRVVPINGTTTVLAMLKQEKKEIPGIFITFVGDNEERTAWEQNFFAHIDDLQMKKNSARTIKARSYKEQVAKEVLNMIEAHPYVHLAGSSKTNSKGAICSTALTCLEKWCKVRGIGFAKEIIDTWAECGWTSNALSFYSVNFIGETLEAMLCRNDDKRMSLSETRKAIAKATEGFSQNGFYSLSRQTYLFHNNAAMAGTKLMLQYCVLNNVRAKELELIQSEEPEVVTTPENWVAKEMEEGVQNDN